LEILILGQEDSKLIDGGLIISGEIFGPLYTCVEIAFCRGKNISEGVQLFQIFLFWGYKYFDIFGLGGTKIGGSNFSLQGLQYVWFI